MNIAITGLVNSGKTTIYNALTGLNTETTIYASHLEEPRIGTVKVPDARIDALIEIFKPKKIAHSTIEYIDFNGLTKGDLVHNRKVLDHLKDADAVLEVIRVFRDEAVVHPDGSVDPIRDLETLEMELIFSDFELVDKRLVRMDESLRKGKKVDEEERAILTKCKEYLEAGTPLRRVEFTQEEANGMRHLQFISIKPAFVVFNIAEAEIGKPTNAALIEQAVKKTGFSAESITALSGKVEMDIAQLSPADAADFLADLGIEEPALRRLVSISYDRLGLIAFLTVGEDEVKSWTIKRGTTALKAAGKVHSDIERGFIRAETIAYADFMRVTGSMAEARKLGLLRLEGKTYIVADGDIINFRFNV